MAGAYLPDIKIVVIIFRLHIYFRIYFPLLCAVSMKYLIIKMKNRNVKIKSTSKSMIQNSSDSGGCKNSIREKGNIKVINKT